MVDPRVKEIVKRKFPSLKVLLVDDMKPNIDNTSFLLDDLGVNKNNITVAGNGLQATLKMTTFKPDLIITDWNMPMTDGLDFVKYVRKIPQNNSIAIIMITAEPDKMMSDVKPYVDAFLKKPFTMKNVEDVIYTVLARRMLKPK